MDTIAVAEHKKEHANRVRSFSTDRFLNFLGRITATELDEITEALSLLIELPQH